MKEFATAITSRQEDELTCEACRMQLPDYVNAQIMGDELGENFAKLAFHLKVCPRCVQEYRELTVLTGQAYTELLPEADHQPQFDFTFLETEKQQTFWWDDLGRLIITFSEELVNALQAATTGQASAGALSRSRRSEEVHLQLSEEETGKDIAVTIRVKKMADEPTQCTALVDVDVPSRGGWPNLGGIEVLLKQNDREDKQITDPHGKAFFKGISIEHLADLVFEIGPDAD